MILSRLGVIFGCYFVLLSFSLWNIQGTYILTWILNNMSYKNKIIWVTDVGKANEDVENFVEEMNKGCWWVLISQTCKTTARTSFPCFGFLHFYFLFLCFLLLVLHLYKNVFSQCRLLNQAWFSISCTYIYNFRGKPDCFMGWVKPNIF